LILPVCEAGEAEGAEAADGPAAGVESVGLEGLLPVAFDAEEVGLALAVGAGVFAAIVARLLESGEETSDAVDEAWGSTEVAGALPAVVDIGEAVVGAESPSVPGAVGGDDRTAPSEDAEVGADEVEGGIQVLHSGTGVGRSAESKGNMAGLAVRSRGCRRS
jgi:hypothetical protein